MDDERAAHASRALALIRSAAHEGDHDFYGEQLRVWEHMRSALLKALGFVAAGSAVPREVWSEARSADCPKEAVPEEVTATIEESCERCGHVHDCEQDVANDEWSPGTMEGERWASDAKVLLDDVLIDEG